MRITRRASLQLMAAALAAVVTGSATTGCGGGGSSGGGAPPPGGGGGGGGTRSVLSATQSAGASVGTSNQFQSRYGDVLVTSVSLNGQSVSGDLNYNPWQPTGASSGQVSSGSQVTWTRVGSGSGNSVSFTA